MSTELAIRPDQTSFDDKQMAALRSLGVQNAPAADVALFFHQAARTGLDPFTRQIYLIPRGGKWTIQTAIDGFRLIRDRKGTYRGHTEEWCGPDGKWTDVWLKKDHPAAARVLVYVDGYQRPVPGIALWEEYAQIGRDGKPQSLWASKPALMLAKCAEALALRKAYPQDLSGLYTTDEIPAAEQDEDGVYVTTTMRQTGPAAAPKQAKRQTVLHDEPVIPEGAEYLRRTLAAHTLDDLRAIWRDAKKYDALQADTGSGFTVDEAITARREHLESEAQGEEPPELDGIEEPL